MELYYKQPSMCEKVIFIFQTIRKKPEKDGSSFAKHALWTELGLETFL